MSDGYEEYYPSTSSAQQLPTQPSTSKKEGPKEELGNQMPEQPAVSGRDSGSDTYEYIEGYWSQKNNDPLEKKDAHDPVPEGTSSWKDRDQEADENHEYENIYEDIYENIGE